MLGFERYWFVFNDSGSVNLNGDELELREFPFNLIKDSQILHNPVSLVHFLLAT